MSNHMGHRCPFCINRRCHLPSFTFCWFIWDTPSIYQPTRDKRRAMIWGTNIGWVPERWGYSDLQTVCCITSFFMAKTPSFGICWWFESSFLGQASHLCDGFSIRRFSGVTSFSRIQINNFTHFLGSRNTGWWFEPPWNILVSWDYSSQYMEKNDPDHQPDGFVKIGYPIRPHSIHSATSNHHCPNCLTAKTGVYTTAFLWWLNPKTNWTNVQPQSWNLNLYFPTFSVFPQDFDSFFQSWQTRGSSPTS